MTGQPPEVVVVGGGHNGLVAAVQLARAGCRVTVVEQGDEPGGCVWTDRHPSGVLLERGAFEHGGVYPLVRELDLDAPELGERAVRYRKHPVAAGFVFGDGQRRVFYTDLSATEQGLADDAGAYRSLVDLAETVFSQLDGLDGVDGPPTLTAVAAALATVPGGDRLFRTLLQPAETVVNAALTDPYLRAALSLQASHAQVPAWAPGSGLFALLLPAAHSGPAVRPEGGSRALIDALVAALEVAGGAVRTGCTAVRFGTAAEIRTAPVTLTDAAGQVGPRERRVGVFGGALTSRTAPPRPAQRSFNWGDRGEVELADGTILTADAVISTLGLPRTAELLSDPAPRLRSAVTGLHSGHFNIAELTVTLVTDRRLEVPFDDRDAIWYAVAAPDDVRIGFGEVLAGQLPSSPWAMVAEVAQPAGVTGSAVWMSSVVPLRRRDGSWTSELEHAAAQRVVDQVGAVLGVDLRVGLVDAVVSGPMTWARRVGGDGNPNHLDNTVDQLLGWRPPGHADMRTELPWLFLSGAGQHPGGGLSGAAGMAAAAAVLTPRRPDPGVPGRVTSELRGLGRGRRTYRAMLGGLR